MDEKPVQNCDVQKNLPGGLDDGVTDDLFSRCYCCVGPEPASRAIPLVTLTNTKSLTKLAAWRKSRLSFLGKKPKSHLGDVGKISGDFLRESRPHRICIKCEAMCSTSRKILTIVPGPRIKHMIGLPLFDRDKFKICQDECYEHYATPAELEQSTREGCEYPGEVVKIGCHLCSLIWATLSPDQ
jgi:hypothetical protein